MSGVTLAISLWNITELTCLLFFSSFLRALYLCLFLICLAPGVLYGDALFMHRPGCCCWSGTFVAPPSRVGKTLWLWLSSTLWCQSIQRISSCFPLTLPPSLSFIHTRLYIVSVPKLAHTRCNHKPSGHAVGDAHVHTQPHEHTHARLFSRQAGFVVFSPMNLVAFAR